MRKPGLSTSKRSLHLLFRSRRSESYKNNTFTKATFANHEMGSSYPVVQSGNMKFRISTLLPFPILVLSCVALSVLSLLSYGYFKPAINYSLTSGSVSTVTSVSPNVGPSSGQSKVTISGSGFISGDTVMFGPNTASVVNVISSSAITAVSPPGTGTVDITVVSSSGTSATSTNDQFNYVAYTPINPVRVCDTRAVMTGVLSNQCNDGTTSNNGPLASNQTININVSGTGPGGILDGIPANATAVVANVTVTNTTQPGGFLTIYPTGTQLPNTSNINFNQNDTVANLVTVGIGQSGDISVYNFNGSADIILDVEGYVAPVSTSTVAGQYVPLNPIRICDTRPNANNLVPVNQCNDGSTSNIGPLASNQTVNINVSGTGPGGILDGIPANATAVVANVTVTNTTQPGGFLTVYPSNDTSVPNASNINFVQNDTVANRVIVPIDTSNGDISIYNFNGSTDLIIDVNGYYTGSNSSLSGSVFNPISPVRICDTRSVNSSNITSNQCNSGTTSNNGPLTQGEIKTIQVSNIDNIPSDATAVVVNVTVTNTTQPGGFLTIFPTPFSGNPVPNISDINFSQNDTVANMSVVKVGNGNSINVFNAVGSADLIVDVTGYFLASDVPSIDTISPSFGSVSGGTSVTILGKGFTNASSVDFGSNPGVIVGQTATELIVTSPAGAAGTIDITVTSPVGTSTIVASDRFTYYSYNIQQQYTSGISTINSITCPNANICYGVGDVQMNVGGLASGVVSADILSDSSGSQNWVTDSLPVSFVGHVQLYCSSTVCYAMGNNSQNQVILLSTAGSFTSWIVDTIPSVLNPSEIQSLTCSANSVCYASYSTGILTATLGATQWSLDSVPGGLDGIKGIVCPTNSVCYAYGYSSSAVGYVLSLTSGSTSWAYDDLPVSVNGVGDIEGISCYLSSVCYLFSNNSASGGLVLSTTPGSTTWSSNQLPSGKWIILGLLCPTSSVCYVYGVDSTSVGFIFSTSPGSSAWSIDSLPIGGWNISGLTCPTSTTCYAYGYETFLSTALGSTTWASDFVPTSTQTVLGVLCPTSTTCYAYGSGTASTGFILSASAGSNNWSNDSLPSGTFGLTGLACSPALICYAYGSETASTGLILSASAGSNNWSENNLPSGLSNLTGATCVSNSICYAFGTSNVTGGFILSTNTGGTSWTEDSLPIGSSSVVGITCYSASICYAYGSNTFLSVSPGSANWSINTVPSGITVISGVVCPSSSICYAYGYNQFGAAVILSATTGSTTWTADVLPSGTQSINGISCPSSSICYAYGGNTLNSGIILSVSIGSLTWSSDTVPSGVVSVAEIYHINCISTITCYAFGGANGGGQNSDSFIISTALGSSSWVSDTLPSGIYTVGDIACPSSTVCYAYGVTTQGSDYIMSTAPDSIIWFNNSVPNGTGNINSLECPAVADCYFTTTASTNGQVQIYGTIPGSNLWVANSVPSGVSVGVDNQTTLSCPNSTICFAFDPVSLGNSPLLVSLVGSNQWGQVTASDFTQIDSVVELSPTLYLIVGFGSNGTGIVFSTMN